MFRKIFYLILRLFGWKVVNNVPDNIRSFVCIGAPHTSNFDFFPAMATLYYIKRNPRFVIKSEWMKPPLGFFFKALGGIGVNRELIKKGVVSSSTDLMANLFKENEDLVILIAPEGTRSPNEKWKTGFYYIAQKANVPIALGFADYKRKMTGIEEYIYPTNFEEDMKKITAYYQKITAKNPEKFKIPKEHL